ncbi:MAG TPA: glycosyltransferase family 2 protein [Chthoniobacterales bacterium]|jgi:glycosyltransferase involved in cell wall biosynthesis
MSELVSILIPAFNAEAFVSNAIASAVTQTWPRKEVVVVDDGSSDRTLSIARQFSSENVSILTQPNQGASSARNKAFSACQGDYIQWLDADDILAPDKIEKQMSAWKSDCTARTLLSSSWGHFRRNIATAKFVPSRLWCDLSPTDWLVRKLGEDLYMQPATWLATRALTEAAGPWDTRLSLDDDGEYFCRLVAASDGVKFVPEAKMFYRRGANTLSDVDYSSKKLESQCLALKLQIEHLLPLEKSDRTKRASLNFLQTYAIYFYPERSDLINELQTIASSLGGRVEIPQLPWKYAWIQKLFGWSAAKRARRIYNQWKSALIGAADHGRMAISQQHGA